MARYLALFFSMLAVTLGAAEPDIEFSGILKDGRETRVSLTNKTSGVSQWVSVGKDFAGYTVKAYDPKTDTLEVVKGGETFRLTMKEGKVKPGASELPAETRRAILNNLRQLAAAADQFYLENGVGRTTYDQLVGPEPKKFVKRIVTIQGEDYTRIEFVQGKPMSVTTVDGFTVSYAP
jgi:hypothetical protein